MSTITINERTIALPSSWNDLDPHRLAGAWQLLSQNTPAAFDAHEVPHLVRIRLLMYLAGLDEAFMRAWERDCIAYYGPEDGPTAFLEELDGLLSELDPLFDIEDDDGRITYSIKLGRTRTPWQWLPAGDTRLYGPDDALTNITFYELVMTFTEFEEWLRTHNDTHLLRLCAILYRPSKPRTKDNLRSAYHGDRRLPLRDHEKTIPARMQAFAKMPEIIPQTISFFFASCRQAIVRRFPRMFSPAVGKATSSTGYANLLLTAAGNISEIPKVADTPAYTVLQWLSMRVEEAEEIQRKMKK